ncbi:MAG: hypothetical protein AB8I08_22660 [Sandaracinaceae bacterium]
MELTEDGRLRTEHWVFEAWRAIETRRLEREYDARGRLIRAVRTLDREPIVPAEDAPEGPVMPEPRESREHSVTYDYTACDRDDVLLPEEIDTAPEISPPYRLGHPASHRGGAVEPSGP